MHFIFSQNIKFLHIMKEHYNIFHIYDLLLQYLLMFILIKQ